MELREEMARIRRAALEAVEPGRAVLRSLEEEGLGVLEGASRLLLLAVGKAAVPMAEAALAHLEGRIVRGLVVTKHGHAAGHKLPGRVALVESGHPVPDAAGLAASAQVEALLREDDWDGLLLLLSGGASALLPAPAAGLTLDDLRRTTELLLRGGLPIGAVNAVRKHLSRLKGGQLARKAAPRPLLALILSDVVGDRLDVIGSGPTVPDPTTYAEAWRALEGAGLTEALPPAVRRHLRAGMAGEVPETPKPGDPIFRRVEHRIVGSNRLAAQAAVAQARELGYRALLLTTFVEGEAREVAKVAAALVKGAREYGDPLPPPLCLVWGGETTVTVRGKGRGGRNQELALAAALALEGCPHFLLMALATDGTDGPTEAAGGLVDGGTVARIRAAGLDPQALLADNDAYRALEAAGDLLITGPTGTNVNDLLVLLVR